MSELIEELEKIRESSREMDVAIFLATRKTMYWKPKNCNEKQLHVVDDVEDINVNTFVCWEGSEENAGDILKYTASLDAVRELSHWVLIHASDIGADGLALVQLGNPTCSPSVEVSGIHPSLEIAWCIAALKTMETNHV